jgi:tRNA(Ile)-lysidine synthase
MKPTDEAAELSSRVASALASCGVSPQETVVVACSGGSDSTALAVLLAQAGRRALVLAHFDHGLRTPEEARADLESVRALAGGLGARLEEGRAAPGHLRQRAAEEGASLEDVARRARYAFLREVCERRGARVAATGHTRDDQVETVLMRLFQGSDVDGLSGIARCGPLPGAAELTVVRPLLSADRAALRAVLESRGVGYSEDRSNADTRYLRNRLRQEVLPAIEAAFPSVRRAVADTAGRLGEAAAALDEAARAALAWEREPAAGADDRPGGDAGDAGGAGGAGGRAAPTDTAPGLRADRRAFFALPPALRRRSLFRAIDLLGGPQRRVPYRFLEPVLDGGRGGRGEEPGAWTGGSLRADRRRVLARGHGIRIELDGRWIACRRDIVPKGDRGYLYCVARSIPPGASSGGIVELELVGSHGRREVVRIRSAALSPPLIARSRRAGDVILLDAGRRSLKRVFQDRAVPREARNVVPVIEDRGGIVGVWGVAAGAENAWRRGVLADAADGTETRARVGVDFSEVFGHYAGQ